MRVISLGIHAYINMLVVDVLVNRQTLISHKAICQTRILCTLNMNFV